MIGVVLAVLAATSNAFASVLQRRAAATEPDSEAFRLSLIGHLIRRREWLGGIGALIAGFLFQAAALRTDGLSLVQPILVTELPITMLLLAWLFRIRLGTDSWLAVGALTVGIAVFLSAAAPSGGSRVPGRTEWVIAALATAGLIAYLVATARATHYATRAAILGVASGLGFSFTAALMKEATHAISGGLVSVLTSWSLYAMILAGFASLYLLQNALQSGTLVAVQPALNIADPVASIAYGVGLFGEDIRLGPWIMVELLGIGLILYGSVRLAESPPIRRHAELTASDV